MKKARALFERLIGGRVRGQVHPFAAAPAIEIRTFSPARFRFNNQQRCDADALELTLALSSMRVEHGIRTMEVRLRDYGLLINSVVEGDESRVLVYLGNYFIVPPELRRTGLATASIAAIRQAFQIAAFGRMRPHQKTVLEGYFVGPGQDWALAMCAGKLPTKSCPAAVDLQRLHAVEARLQLLTPPLPLGQC